MPAIDPKKLQRLLVLEVLLPFALKRGLTDGQAQDLVSRATKDRRFDLSAVSDEFANLMNSEIATYWAEEFERGGTAPHIFGVEEELVDPGETFGGITKAQLAKLSPEARIELANKVSADAKKR